MNTPPPDFDDDSPILYRRKPEEVRQSLSPKVKAALAAIFSVIALSGVLGINSMLSSMEASRKAEAAALAEKEARRRALVKRFDDIAAISSETEKMTKFQELLTDLTSGDNPNEFPDLEDRVKSGITHLETLATTRAKSAEAIAAAQDRADKAQRDADRKVAAASKRLEAERNRRRLFLARKEELEGEGGEAEKDAEALWEEYKRTHSQPGASPASVVKAMAGKVRARSLERVPEAEGEDDDSLRAGYTRVANRRLEVLASSSNEAVRARMTELSRQVEKDAEAVFNSLPENTNWAGIQYPFSYVREDKVVLAAIKRKVKEKTANDDPVVKDYYEELLTKELEDLVTIAKESARAGKAEGKIALLTKTGKLTREAMSKALEITKAHPSDANARVRAIAKAVKAKNFKNPKLREHYEEVLTAEVDNLAGAFANLGSRYNRKIEEALAEARKQKRKALSLEEQVQVIAEVITGVPQEVMKEFSHHVVSRNGKVDCGLPNGPLSEFNCTVFTIFETAYKGGVINQNDGRTHTFKPRTIDVMQSPRKSFVPKMHPMLASILVQELLKMANKSANTTVEPVVLDRFFKEVYDAFQLLPKLERERLTKEAVKRLQGKD